MYLLGRGCSRGKEENEEGRKKRKWAKPTGLWAKVATAVTFLTDVLVRVVFSGLEGRAGPTSAEKNLRHDVWRILVAPGATAGHPH